MVSDEKDLVQTKSELSSLKKTKKTKKPLPKPLLFGLRVLGVSLFSLVMGANAQIIYNYSRYEKFYVNGESMYPTLNRYTKITNSDGKDISHSYETPDLGDFIRPGYSYTCDYGLMDTRKQALSSLNRFDLVVSYFPSDMVKDEGSGTYSPKGNGTSLSASLKIKRIIGLPGERVYFDENGDLFVCKPNEDAYEKVSQPFLERGKDWDDSLTNWVEETKRQSALGVKHGTSSSPMVLSDDEYFLVGDNRKINGSRDSREIGAVPSYCFVGKAIAITAQCEYTIDNDGNASQSLLFNTVLMPWEIRFL